MLTKFTHRKHENSTKTTHILAGYVYIYDIPARSKYPEENKNRYKFEQKIRNSEPFSFLIYHMIFRKSYVSH